MCDTCGGHAKTHEHDHAHGHEHAHSHRVDLGKEGKNLLSASARVANQLRDDLSRRGILMLNITSAPGSGKTALLQATLPALPKGSAAVLVGDLETERDAARLRGLGAEVRQINTGKGCHLSAAQVASALDKMNLEGVDTLFVENVGNMACPSDHDLGEHGRVAILSLPEGDDKVAKYPGLFAAADLILLNKIDLASILPFDETVFTKDIARLNSRAQLIKISASTGHGLDEWMNWLRRFRISKLISIRDPHHSKAS